MGCCYSREQKRIVETRTLLPPDGIPEARYPCPKSPNRAFPSPPFIVLHNSYYHRYST